MPYETEPTVVIRQFRTGPLQQVLVLIAAILLLIPIVAIVLLGVLVFGAWQLVRIAVGSAPRPGARPTGPVIDVEVTRRVEIDARGESDHSR